MTDRYIVVFKNVVENPVAITNQLAKANGVNVHHRYRYAIKGFAATIPEKALEGIRHNPNVDYIEPDGIATINGYQNNLQSWGLDRIDQTGPLYGILYNDLYIYPNDGSGVTVYIIDSGILFGHQEFGNRASSGYDFVDRDNDASEYCNGHGTHVAGIVGGATTGVAKNVNLVAVRVLDCSGSGRWSQILAGIDWVKNNHSGPSVANLSLGGAYRKSVNSAVENSIAAGIVYCVSAGNNNNDACNYSPGSTAAAITVASSMSGDYRAPSSNYGTCVDIFAPGEYIYSATAASTSSYANWSGTSMASPHVAGVAALYLSANSSATPAQTSAAIIAGATQGVMQDEGAGSPDLLLYTGFIAPTLNPPSAPTNMSATSTTPGQVDLSWTDNATNEVGYIVHRRRHSQPWRYITTLGANVTSWSSTGLVGGTFYYYRVHAYNGGGYSDYSDLDSVTVAYPQQTSPPAAPSNLHTVVVNPHYISIWWDDNSDNEDGFRIERSLNGGSSWTEIATADANWTNFGNSGLTPQTQYWYRVRAYNSVGASGYSNTISATTPAPPPGIDVFAVSGSTTTQGKNSWYGHLTVTVYDENNQPADGVTVSVSWSGGATGSGTAQTNSSGECTVSTDRLGKNVSSVIMSVTDLTKSGYNYKQGLFSAATSATVNQP
ncbi:S8 family serine peptidase [bacterium]|nr:S8 family serine peptidase [bacterium]